MPIYEYECEKCGDKFEYFLRWGGDEKNVKCPKCGSENP
jgi:putative FmdB family regulatory protein